MNNDVQVHQSTLFRRAYKRLHPNEKADVDDAITEIIKSPTVGEQKKGDLAGVFVYKFKCNGQLTLLAYEYDAVSRLLLLLGSHENFYRTLKR
jgi:mRNA interferase RelE/StbE